MLDKLFTISMTPRIQIQKISKQLIGQRCLFTCVCSPSASVNNRHWCIIYIFIDVCCCMNGCDGLCRRHSISQQLPGSIRHPFNDGEPWKYTDLRYLATMADVPALINIAISLKIQPNDGPVFYKVDGTRFGQSRTIKMLTGSKYKIEVIVKPGSAEAT